MDISDVLGPTPRAGVGLRLPHLIEVAEGAPSAPWLEVHPENFLANPHAAELLHGIAARQPLSLHTVGVSVGSTDGVDREHLGRLRRLIEAIDPAGVSCHLAWSTHRGLYLNDLLPLPYDEQMLGIVAAHVSEVQDALGRAVLVENPASYLGFAASTMPEAEFLTELVERTGCGLLCDVSNVYVSAANMGYDPYAYLDALPANAIAELHLGGFTPEVLDTTTGDQVLIDTHSAAIAAPVWDLYAYALRRFGPRPTLIEWDNDLPPFARLLEEAERADSIAAAVLDRDRAHAVAG